MSAKICISSHPFNWTTVYERKREHECTISLLEAVSGFVSPELLLIEDG